MDGKQRPTHKAGSGNQPQIVNNVNVNQPSPKQIGVLERDHKTALLLSIFLGWCGIDSFYLGKTGKGILKMFTLGLFGILWVIDVIMIATKSVNNIVWKDQGTSTNKDSGNWFKRHKIITVILAIIVIGIIASVAGGSKSTTTNSSNSSVASQSKSSATAPTTPGLNQQANDGKFGFTVTSFQCGITEIDQPDNTAWTSTSGNPYCELGLSIKDISTVSQTFDDDAQNIYSSTGNQYSVDDDATISANNSNNNCMDDPTVNPGVTITCTLAFDVPSSVTPTYAKLHDSSLSDGVKVNLQ